MTGPELSAAPVNTVTVRLKDANIKAGVFGPYASEVDRITDLKLKANKLTGGLNTDRSPDISYLIRCIDESHGNKLAALNPRQMIEWFDTHDKTGCGHTGYKMSMLESLALLMEDQDIMCWKCKSVDLVKADEGCPAHSNTKCESLLVVALGQISKFYRLKSVVQSTKGITIPFVTIPGHSNQIFPVELTTGLKLHPMVRLKLPLLLEQLLEEIGHLEYGSLVSTLCGSDKGNSSRGESSQPHAPIVGPESLRLIVCRFGSKLVVWQHCIYSKPMRHAQQLAHHLII